MSLLFEWDPNKAEANLAKHGVSFEEAMTIFADPLARIFPDEDHSVDELREIIIGHSAHQQLILVNFIDVSDGVRLFSARKATPSRLWKNQCLGLVSFSLLSLFSSIGF
jgi:uncharacterized DUF497 family protein